MKDNINLEAERDIKRIKQFTRIRLDLKSRVLESTILGLAKDGFIIITKSSSGTLPEVSDYVNKINIQIIEERLYSFAGEYCNPNLLDKYKKIERKLEKLFIKYGITI